VSDVWRKALEGDIVRLHCIDWCRHQYQMAPENVEAQATLKGAVVYGVIAAMDQERIAIAAQQFTDGDYRDVLAIPMCCVINYEILGNVADQRFIQQDREVGSE
jgi:hypothetical protein